MYRETRGDDCFSPSLPYLQSRLCVFTIRRNLVKMPGVYIFLNNVRPIKGRSRIGCRPANQLTSDNFEPCRLSCCFTVNE